MSDLGKRAVACKHWKWMYGMRHFHDTKSYFNTWRILDDADRLDVRCDGTVIPDIDDPATLGCLLALVREAWGDQNLYAQYRTGLATPWRVWMPGDPVGYGKTEAEALISALEAAP